MVGENGNLDLESVVIQESVQDAVNEAVKEAVRDAVETAVEQNGSSQ
jgi:DNA-binding protein YbaB